MDETVKLDIRKDMVKETSEDVFTVDTGLTANELILFVCGIDPKIDRNIVIPLTAKLQQLRAETRRAIDAQIDYSESYFKMKKEADDLRVKNSMLEHECNDRRRAMKGWRW